MVTEEDFTENEHQRKWDVSIRYALPGMLSWCKGKDQSVGYHSCMMAPAKTVLEGNPSDGYPLGLPAGVAGGLSGK